jgi:hypothetical protein
MEDLAVGGSVGIILPVVVERSTMYEQDRFDKGQNENAKAFISKQLNWKNTCSF